MTERTGLYYKKGFRVHSLIWLLLFQIKKSPFRNESNLNIAYKLAYYRSNIMKSLLIYMLQTQIFYKFWSDL